MNVKDLKKALKIMRDKRITSLIVGPAGIGKSQITASVAREAGIGLIDLRAGQLDVADIHGLMSIEYDENNKPIASTFVPPKWWPKKGTEGILFLDEINRAREDLQQALFQLILDYRIHEHVLPKGWTVVAAANPDTDDYIVNELNDKAWYSRFWQVNLVPEVKDFCEHHKSINNEKLAGFISAYPEIYNKAVSESKSDLNVKTTSRSLEMAHTVLLELLKQNEREDFILEILMGFIEASDANNMFSFYNNERRLNVLDVLNGVQTVDDDINKKLFFSKLIDEINSGKITSFTESQKQFLLKFSDEANEDLFMVMLQTVIEAATNDSGEKQNIVTVLPKEFVVGLTKKSESINKQIEDLKKEDD